MPVTSLKLSHRVDLEKLNTFGLPARSDFMIEIETAEAGLDFCKMRALACLPRLILGGGSNIILTGDFEGVVLKVAIPGRRLVRETEQAWIVEGGAGENWHAFVQWTLKQGWSGLENLSLIPGTVGAAPVQNIGAYGVELSSFFDSLDAIELDKGEQRTFTHEECGFAYRDSVFKRESGRWLITRVRFCLPKQWKPCLQYTALDLALRKHKVTDPEPLDVANAVIAIRQQKLPDPCCIGNAGSFFKNPVVSHEVFSRLVKKYPAMPYYAQQNGIVKLAAGWLIEQTGWKGRSDGTVGCFEHQALVLINRGGATGEDVKRVSCAIQEEVDVRFGVRLEVEPMFY